MTIFIGIILFLGGVMTGVVLTAMLSCNTDADELQTAYDQGYEQGRLDAENNKGEDAEYERV